MSDKHEVLRRIDDLHVDIQEWIAQHLSPRAPAVFILTALTYEVGRLADLLTDDMSDKDRDKMLRGVLDTMRVQMHHCRARRRAEQP